MDKIEVIINGEKHLLIEEANSDSVQCYNCSLHHLCETGSENITALCVLLSRNLNCRFIPQEHHRTPTFSDAIEITRKQIIEKACKRIEYYNNGGYLLDDWKDDFIKAMEG